MNRTNVQIRTVLALVGVTLGLTACSYATPDTSSVGISYTGGSFESQRFDKCVTPGTKEATNWGGETYYYPVGIRTYTFANTPGADGPPIGVSTSNNQELIVSGNITFTLNTDCTKYTDKTGREWPGGHLQLFHDTVGRAKGAFFGEDSTEIPRGWRDVLGIYLGGPANRAMDQQGGAYTWQDLYSKQDVANAWTDAVKKAIPPLIAAQTGGEDFFNIVSIQVDKPTVPDALRGALEDQQRAILAQQTADQQKAFATAWPGGLDGYQRFQREQAEIKCLDTGKCTLVPAGTSVGVPAG